MKLLKRHRCFGGTVGFYEHASTSTRTPMRFSVFLPPQAESGKVPVVYFLSGLTCTEENFITKAGAQCYAAALGLMLVCPDTSPRGAGVEGEAEHWDFGLGAGFYVNATEPKWAKNYRMDDYVRDELPRLIEAELPAAPGRRGIMGHSMGGHGALVLALRNPGLYRSVSALSPICAPTQCPWGEKALGGYLGADRNAWLGYDASHLVTQAAAEGRLPLLVDQGGDDEFLKTQLKPELLRAACDRVGYPLELRLQPGYDHSYYFIQSFIADHLAHHAKHLR